MTLKFERKSVLSARSDRVKCVDMHPTEPWILSTLYNGKAYIWNYNTQVTVKTIEVADVPVRAGRFIARKNWMITGSDDLLLRVFNYSTTEKLHTIEAHQDYIRSIAVHPTRPYVLSSSDDMTIKLWDWDKAWKLITVFEGHAHYVMAVLFNPKDTNTFASASLDRTIKIWSLGSTTPNYTLEGHEKGVNCIDYYEGGDKPYLISGADDRLVKIWDYQNKSCIQTLDGHSQNVSAVAFHPELPIIITTAEDSMVKIWNSSTYKLESKLNPGYERGWTMARLKGSHMIGIGFDEGTVVWKFGNEEPCASMDLNGKIVWTKQNVAYTTSIKSGIESSVSDGEKLNLPIKELGHCEIFPISLKHSPNGRFVAVCGDNEYIIYTALAWRSKAFDKALDFVWGSDSNFYAMRPNNYSVNIYKDFKTEIVINTDSSEGIFGGNLLGIKFTDCINFYDWESGTLIRRIDVVPKQICWSDSNLVAIICENSFYLLRYNSEVFKAYLDQGIPIPSDGIEEAFEVVSDISESVVTCCFAGDSFVYTTLGNRLCYSIGGNSNLITHFEKPLYLLGYFSKENRLYLADKEMSIVSYTFLMSVIEFQSLIISGKVDDALNMLATIPEANYNKLSKFLELKGFKREALNLTSDVEHKFDLSLQLQNLDYAFKIAEECKSLDKWKQCAETAISMWEFVLAEKALWNAQDLSGLLVFLSASNNVPGLRKLADISIEKEQLNIAFTCFQLCGNYEGSVKLLLDKKLFPEAAFYARNYVPAMLSTCVNAWKTFIHDTHPNFCHLLADPSVDEDFFPDFQESLKINLDRSVKADTLSSSSKKTETSDAYSDNQSHISMEVNTTGTYSIHCDDFGEGISARNLEIINDEYEGESEVAEFQNEVTFEDGHEETLLENPTDRGNNNSTFVHVADDVDNEPNDFLNGVDDNKNVFNQSPPNISSKATHKPNEWNDAESSSNDEFF